MSESEGLPSAGPCARDRPRVGVLVGSPRRGNCERLSARVAEAVEAAGCEVRTALLREHDVAPCVGCGACERTGVCVLFAREAPGRDAPADPDVAARATSPRLTFPRPGFLELLAWLDGLDGLALVAPVYFSGPPAQLKALLDRMQFLWARRYLMRCRPPLPGERRRPLLLVAVGGGGDPFGLDPLVTCVRSSLRMMDFELRESCAVIGYRTAGSTAADDEGHERRACAAASAFGREVAAQGAFARRGEIDPWTP